jgi:uncharacterized protein YndB with AHSA1/START domain
MGQTGKGTAFVQGGTRVERTSDREMVVTRTFDAPPRIVFEAWTRPELFMRWWAPKSMGVPIRACEMDVRTGGGYRLEFGQDASQSFAFFGRYVEVEPNARLVWTNEEGEGDGALTTVTFEAADGGGTLLTYRDLYPSKEALDESLVGMESAMPEQFEQLDGLLASLGKSAEGA